MEQHFELHKSSMQHVHELEEGLSKHRPSAAALSVYRSLCLDLCHAAL